MAALRTTAGLRPSRAAQATLALHRTPVRRGTLARGAAGVALPTPAACAVLLDMRLVIVLVARFERQWARRDIAADHVLARHH